MDKTNPTIEECYETAVLQCTSVAGAIHMAQELYWAFHPEGYPDYCEECDEVTEPTEKFDLVVCSICSYVSG